jgi:hypothetical protein
MTKVIAGAFLVLGLLGPAYPYDLVEGKKWAEFFKAKYWNCLAGETKRMLQRSLSGQDFALFLKGACPAEANKFRVALVDYLAMMHPDMEISTYVTSANEVISLTQADYVKTYIEMKSESKK